MNKYDRAKEDIYQALWTLCDEDEREYEIACDGTYIEPIIKEVHNLAIKLDGLSQKYEQGHKEKKRLFGKKETGSLEKSPIINDVPVQIGDIVFTVHKNVILDIGIVTEVNSENKIQTIEARPYINPDTKELIRGHYGAIQHCTWHSSNINVPLQEWDDIARQCCTADRLSKYWEEKIANRVEGKEK